MRKRLCMALVLIMMSVGFLFAQGSSEAPEVAEDGKIHISYYTWEDATHRALVEAFNNSQDEIYVDAQILASADYDIKIATLLSGKADIDCFMEKRQVDMFGQYENGIIEPLDEYFEKTGYSTEAVDTYKDQVVYDGHILGIPWRGGARYTYFNKKVFENAGIPTPDYYVERGEWTWDKFVEVAEALADPENNIYGACIHYWAKDTLNIASQNYQDIITMDGEIEIDDSFHRALQIRKELEEKHAVVPLINSKVTSLHYSKAFYDGNVGMLILGEWFPGQMVTGDAEGLLRGFTKEDYGITRLPCDVDPYVTQGASTNNHITSYSNKKDAAFEFINWMSGPEAASIVASYGVLPAVNYPEVEAVLAEVLPDQSSLDYFVEPKTIWQANFTPYGTRVESFIDTFQEQYILGEITDEDFDAEFRAGLQEIIDTTY